MAKQWSEFTREEKREERFQRWLSPAGVNFISPEAGKKYLAKATRLMQAIKMEIPDRVPVTIPSSTYVAYNAGIGGNITAAQLLTQTPRAIKEYCRKLITVCGENGGYILTLGSSIDRCNPANLQAIIEAAKEYGVY